jgi:hypothetical protein
MVGTAMTLKSGTASALRVGTLSSLEELERRHIARVDAF